MKSGTNSIHGEGYEYFRNRNLNALDVLLNNEGVHQLPRYDNNRFGGEVGGPIVKNKLSILPTLSTTQSEKHQFRKRRSLQLQLAGARLAGLMVFRPAMPLVMQIMRPRPQPALRPRFRSGICPAGGLDQLGNPIAAGNVAVYDHTTATPTQYQIPVGVIPVVAPFYSNTRALVTSMDYNMSEKDQIRGRYIYNRVVTIDNGAELPAFFTNLTVPYHLVTLGEYHTFSPTVANEFRVGFNRTGNDYTVPGFKFQGLDAFPNLTIDELNGINVGPDPNAPQYATQNTYQIADNFSWAKGNHSFKFGVDYKKQIDPSLFIQRARGDYEWNYLDVFVHDQLPTGIDERSFGSAGYNGNDSGVGWYANDVWKISRNLSLNLGLRYEFLSVPYGWTQQGLNSLSSVPGLITFASPTAPKKDFMPRIGFAYSPGNSGNTSIRGGFSMGYDVLYDNIGSLARPPQIGFTVDCPGEPQCPVVSGTNGFLAQGGIPPQAVSGIQVLPQAQALAETSAYLPPNTQYPYAESWNLGIQHVMGPYTIEVRYVGSRGIHLPVQNRMDTVSGISATHNVPEFINAPSQGQIDALTFPWSVNAATCPASVCPAGAGDAPGTLAYEYYDLGTYFPAAFANAGFGSIITGYLPLGSSNYHGLQTQVQRRLTKGLQFQAAWTWSHTLDNSTADFHSTDITPRRAQDFQNYAAEYGNSLLDHSHRVTLQVLYDVPWFAHDDNWLKKNILGNYEFIPVFTWESGQWGTVQSGIDSNLNVDAAGDRAIYNSAGVKGTGSDVNPVLQTSATSYCAYPPCTMGWQAANPNAQYIVAGYGVVANTGRGNLETPPLNNFDITAAKHLKFGERYQLDFLAQAFNALNHPQFVTGYINDIGSFGNTGAIRSAFHTQRWELQ